MSTPEVAISRRSQGQLNRWVNASEETKKAFSEGCRVRAIKQMSEPAARKHLSDLTKERWKREGYVKRFQMTPEIKAKIGASQKGTLKEWMKDPERVEEALAKISAKGAKRFKELGTDHHELFRPEVRERALANSVEEMKTNPRRGRFETNMHARDWHLRDPYGDVYHFRNLKHFIREHRHLFSSRQLELNSKGVPRVYNCLSQLSPRLKRPVSRSQGWTWVWPETSQ